MLARWFASKLFGPIVAVVAVLLLAATIVQTVRIDGFPLFYTGLRTQLLECRDAQRVANEAADAALAKAREEGRLSAAADAQRLLQEEMARRQETDKVIVDLQKAVMKLRPIAPPPVILPGQPLPPIVVTPPALPAVCHLDQSALDSIRGTLNAQRISQ